MDVIKLDVYNLLLNKNITSWIKRGLIFPISPKMVQYLQLVVEWFDIFSETIKGLIFAAGCWLLTLSSWTTKNSNFHLAFRGLSNSCCSLYGKVFPVGW